ncbi:hypothetical protein COV42_00450 [Candidatus Campbellbacteria bacterium CG11_big_fil_rev_8_21_14_0_20_44_21]|uniref:DUF427 domain-containing protein n=1 Tax=Candidatus Campbellbacteria bacterium CG22_combo_CG10-13_8_21_14_all_43_18 TaxID=1974530 RepID=A0A2H0DWU9_9BACT|nr:MAG: hypothetical protein COW82_00800 [Candidatus Campbellbacteria bacterium CG22_combo_CG10-13_8_21_14_all_43_18]PIR24473.1 MAG: hypothetical protein COV42_00450 [Candidatus Campbellbacteria bacterium CG11_big_fil_rev_8_21_14_0_20_44_21]
MKAIWKNTIIAESDKTIIVEGNHYFPPDSIRHDYLSKSKTHSTCPYKGEADYYDIIVAGEKNPDAAWSYPEPKKAFVKIKRYVAFWKGVSVLE